ncbi:MAG: antibiotic biosynthesis monooxygenase [Planctomycetota bacterium]
MAVRLAFFGLTELGLIAVVALVVAVAFVVARRRRTRRPPPDPTRTLTPGSVGFAVLYRWRIVPGREDDFRVAWERLTHQIRERRGGLGSRLHRGKDGIWWAYAQWPSEERWRAAQALETVDSKSSSRMGEAILERFDPVPLIPVADLLVTEPRGPVGGLE